MIDLETIDYGIYLNIDRKHILWEKSEYTKGVIRWRKSKDRQYNDQTKTGLRIYKTFMRKRKIEQHLIRNKSGDGVNQML